MEQYIVIDKLGGGQYAFILVDESHNNMVFTDRDKAQEYCDEHAQDGIVVKL